jgi:NAD(P)-dependent dehydrogenase (short-subunit alcohol dehydrogenase family)
MATDTDVTDGTEPSDSAPRIDGWDPGQALLAGKVAVVAGGGRGIGEATARLLAAAGAAVAVVDLEEERARAVRDAIVGAGGRAVPIVADVLDEAQSIPIVDSAVSTFGGIDVLVNVAGGMNVFGHWQPLTQWSSAEWDAVVGLNLRYHFLLCRAAIPRLAERGGGSIVNITSVSGVFGSPNHSAYGAAKAGLIHLTKTLALEVGRLGIRVNAVSPGAVFTPATANRLTPERRSEMERTTPLQRAGAPEDIARAVLFFASPLAAYVTGQMLLVDGGVAAKFPLHAPGADPSEAHQ